MRDLDLGIQKIIVISLYTVIVGLIVAFVVTAILVRKKVILKYSNSGIKRFFGNSLLYYSLRRIGSAIITMFLAIIVTYFLLRFNYNPNNFCDGIFIKFPVAIRPQLCDQMLTAMGYTGSTFEQLLRFIYNVIPFPKEISDFQSTDLNGNAAYIYWGIINFGNGYQTGKTALTPLIQDMIGDYIGLSLVIGAIGFIVSELLGYPFGVLLAKYKNKWFDKVGNACIILVFAIPSVVFYYLFKQAFDAMGFPMLYTSTNFASLIAPGLIMGLGSFWSIALWVRRYMVDEFGSDYVKFARSKGVPENKIMYKHVLRNAIIPLVRSFPASILYCLVGSFFIESIYSVPGIGYQLYDALTKNNFPAVQGFTIFSAFISVIASVSGDILTAVCDPRISFTAND